MIILSASITSPAVVLVISALTMFFSSSAAASASVTSCTLLCVSKALTALLAALMVDSVSSQLQDYIFSYRTHKAAVDLAYAEKLCSKTKAEYEDATRAYSNYADQHLNATRESANTQREYLRNEMDLKFQLYTQYSQQAAVARGRLQARTPVYNIIQPPVVPVKKSAPKRMIIVVLWEIIVFCGMSVWLVLHKEKES